MPKPTAVSAKRLLINKANTRIVIFVGAAAFILVFSLVATKTLISQAAYQNKVISAKKKAVTQLKADIAATGQLKTSYQDFTTGDKNVLGGDPRVAGGQNGNNAKIVLDALPSTYDFPGLTTSLETLLTAQSVRIDSISGIDDEVAQSSNTSSVNPQPVPIPFSVSVGGDYTQVQNVVASFEKSIRPIQLSTLSISGGGQKLVLTMTAQTYYQPAKSLNIKKQVVK